MKKEKIEIKHEGDVHNKKNGYPGWGVSVCRYRYSSYKP